MLLNHLFLYFLNLRMDSLLMHLENMLPNSLVKEKGIFILNGLNMWYQISMQRHGVHLLCIRVFTLFISTIFAKLYEIAVCIIKCLGLCGNLT